MTSSITRLVLAITSTETDETLERWQFDIHTDEAAASGSSAPAVGGERQAGASSAGGSNGGKGKKKEKTEKEVQGEIREIMKQITSSVTFLPILEDPCECLPSIPHSGLRRGPTRHIASESGSGKMQ